MISVDRGLKNLKRVRQIIGVFIKYGFKDTVDRLPNARRFIPAKIQTQFLKGSSPERLRLALQELGTTFIKLGQILSVRTDMLPDDLTRELSKLQDEVESIPFKEIKGVIEKELNAPLTTLFTSFSQKAIASASLAEVHRATLKGNHKVVVKVQRPNVKEITETDLSILGTIAGWMEKEIPEAKRYGPLLMVKELERNLKSELNFTEEGRAIDRFRNNFKYDESVIIPEVYWEFSTSKLLTMEYIKGVKITDPSVPERMGLSQKEIARKGVDFSFKQIFEHRFFHADPHPGNILITKDGKISLIDFGLMGVIDDETLGLLGELMVAGINKDTETMTEILIELGIAGEKVNKQELRADLRDFVERYYGATLSQIDLKDVLNDLFKITRRYGLKMPRSLLLLAKTTSTLEGLIFQLDPEFNTIEQLEPYIHRLIKRRYSPKRVLENMSKTLRIYYRLFKKLPGDLTSILREIRDGTLKIELEHKGLEDLITHSERSANRLSLSLIIAALIVGSTLVLQTGKLFLLGIIGFIITGIFGIGLIIAVLRSGRL